MRLPKVDGVCVVADVVEALQTMSEAVLRLIAQDKTTEEISKEVFLSPRTIETIRQNMKTKVGVKTIAGLIMYGTRNKLID